MRAVDGILILSFPWPYQWESLLAISHFVHPIELRVFVRRCCLLWSKLENTVKNSYHKTCSFAEFIRGKTLNADELLVSFDGVSFFTKIHSVRKGSRQDATLFQRTSMSIEDIIDLASFFFISTPHTLRSMIDIYYQWVFGTTMGSPVSLGFNSTGRSKGLRIVCAYIMFFHHASVERTNYCNNLIMQKPFS
jgi:hypothetical protein